MVTNTINFLPGAFVTPFPVLKFNGNLPFLLSKSKNVSIVCLHFYVFVCIHSDRFPPQIDSMENDDSWSYRWVQSTYFVLKMFDQQ